jgi:hypothetical protein
VLAEKLGMTVAQLEAEMSVEEFIEWSIFFQLQAEETEKQRKEAMNGGKSNHKGHIRRR